MSYVLIQSCYCLFCFSTSSPSRVGFGIGSDSSDPKLGDYKGSMFSSSHEIYKTSSDFTSTWPYKYHLRSPSHTVSGAALELDYFLFPLVLYFVLGVYPLSAVTSYITFSVHLFFLFHFACSASLYFKVFFVFFLHRVVVFCVCACLLLLRT